VVGAWFGNSRIIAERHYLQVTDADFDRAIGNPMRQTMYSTAVTNGQQPPGENVPRSIYEKSDNSRELHASGVGDEGLEPPTFAV
jgi:hypothetical protein